jgi:poly-gamma-glutamate synthesis protein (capsule biosynthesis protein)
MALSIATTHTRPVGTSRLTRENATECDRPTVAGFVGDVMLGRRVSESLVRSTPDRLLGDLPSVLSGCDGVIANLESPITRHAVRWSHCWKAFHYRAVPAAIDWLRAARICAVSLANNHILDFETRGLLDTCQYLDKAGIAYAGAGTTSECAKAGTLFRIATVTFGLLGITDNMPEWRLPTLGACTFYTKITDDLATVSAIASKAEKLRGSGADIVVLSIHWGWMPIPIIDPPCRYRRFARRMIDCGIDIVHGHSSHLLQGVETYGGGLILYDTGNFMDDYWVLPGFPMDRSAMFMLEFQGKVPVRLQIVPISRRRCHAECASGRAREAILRNLEARCRRLGTRTIRIGNRLAIDLPGMPPCVKVRRMTYLEQARAAGGMSPPIP